MSKPYKAITAVTVLITLLSISYLNFARERFFERALNAQEANKLLTTAVDILTTTKLWQDSAIFILIPDVEIVTEGIGGNFGRGILVARSSEKAWGNPVFMRIASGKIETLDHTKSIAILLTFNHQQDLNSIKNGGVDATQAQVYAYDGQDFTQVSLTGLINVEINQTSNANFYGQRIDVADVIEGKTTTDSEPLTNLMAVLNH